MLKIDSSEQAGVVKTALETANTAVTKYAVTAAEQRLDAQTSIMIAADTRSLAMARIGVSIAAVSLSLFLALIEISELSFVVLAPVVTLIILSIVGAFWCYRAAKPVDVFPVGWEPVDFIDDGGLDDLAFQASVAAYMGQRIDTNNSIMASNARKFSFGVNLIFLAPVCSTIIFVGLETMT